MVTLLTITAVVSSFFFPLAPSSMTAYSSSLTGSLLAGDKAQPEASCHKMLIPLK